MKDLLYSCLLIARLPSGSRTLNWDLETIYTWVVHWLAWILLTLCLVTHAYRLQILYACVTRPRVILQKNLSKADTIKRLMLEVFEKLWCIPVGGCNAYYSHEHMISRLSLAIQHVYWWEGLVIGILNYSPVVLSSDGWHSCRRRRWVYIQWRSLSSVYMQGCIYRVVSITHDRDSIKTIDFCSIWQGVH